ncbi:MULTISPECIES: hypothetical protein [Staphylococcus]|nr:hypothetical protein [Staphylococcus schweitzeri]CDR55232.1 hypothetical protein ERS140266_02636 [Staphylococcus schweitzeri]CDR67711.1 hypothetical protein ERS140167_02630 [Staphylococcus schweitzeri]
MKKRKIKKHILVLTATALLATSFNGIQNQTVHANTQQSQTMNIEKESQDLEKGIHSYFNLLEKMPESIAEKGIDEGVKWLNKNKGDEYIGYVFINENNNLKLIKDPDRIQPRANLTACISAIGVVIASNAIPWAKIIKVKKAMKAKGGIQTMAKAISTAYKHQRKLGYSRKNAIKRAADVATRTFPKATRNAVIEFFSLGGLSSCF